jgi:Formin Homology 2 Domain
MKGTIWEKIDDTKIKIDIKELETVFTSKNPTPAGGAATSKPVEVKPMKISMLTPERLKSIELILGKLKMSNTKLVESLWALDEDFLKPNIIDALCTAVP